MYFKQLKNSIYLQQYSLNCTVRDAYLSSLEEFAVKTTFLSVLKYFGIVKEKSSHKVIQSYTCTDLGRKTTMGDEVGYRVNLPKTNTHEHKNAKTNWPTPCPRLTRILCKIVTKIKVHRLK